MALTIAPATMTCLTYDTIITMDREIKHFWSSPLRLVSIVYFSNRYSGIFGEVARILYYTYSVSREVCKFAMWTRVISDWFTIILIDYILMVRVTALFSRAKFLSLLLQVLLVLEIVLMLGLVIHITLAEGLTQKTFAKGVTVCAESHNVIGFGIAFWSIPMAYSTILFALALYKAIGYWTINRGFEGLTLVRVLIQDQIIYYVLAISCNLLNVLEFKLRVSNGLLSALLDTLGSPAFLCILGSRMLLNLREAGEKGSSNGTSIMSKETDATTLRFS